MIVGSSQFGQANLKTLDVETFPQRQAARPIDESVGEREVLKETGLRSTARCCGHRRHRQANSVRVCSPASRRLASLRPRSAGLTTLTPAPRTLVQTGSC